MKYSQTAFELEKGKQQLMGYLDTGSWIVLTPNREMEFVHSRRLKLEQLCTPVECFLNLDHFPTSELCGAFFFFFFK